MNTLLTQAKSYPSPLTAMSLLGTAVDVTVRLKNVKGQTLLVVSDDVKVRFSPAFVVAPEDDGGSQRPLITLYTTAVVMSRSSVPSHVSVCLPSICR